MKTLTVIAAFEARPGKEAELRTALIGLVAPTRQEAGCLNYDLHISPENPAKFLFHENWMSQAALDAHMQTPHIQNLRPRVNDLCPDFPTITVWDRIP
ncbi:MAG: antibiotic biosynthesis monooxygenase [Akkermansiaceae bacterium]|nr:antibiotic biosynthesis monooxygenase [Verrucomicrobiales bacterium]